VGNSIQGPNRRNQAPYRVRGYEDFRPRFNPPVCAICGNPHIRPFSSIYGRGTTFYTRIKGLIFKHGYERTRRQSVLASQCTPPISLPWWPTVFAVFLYLGTRWEAGAWQRFGYVLDLAGYYIAWVAMGSAAITGVNNFGFYPQRMQTWSSSYYCDRCGSRTILDK
jgi:hypothetical protein